jgi:hypothetical protein
LEVDGAGSGLCPDMCFDVNNAEFSCYQRFSYIVKHFIKVNEMIILVKYDIFMQVQM